MPNETDFSPEFLEALEMMEKLSAYPLLMEHIVQQTVFQDFTTALEMYLEETG